MATSYLTRARRACALMSSVLLLSAAGAASAATVTIPAGKANYAFDGCTWGTPIADGQFQNVFGGPNLYVQRQSQDGIQCEYRTGFDFVLPPEVYQAGVTIQSAVIRVNVTNESVPAADTIKVYPIVGSGAPFVPDDFEATNALLEVPLPASPNWPAVRDFSVPSHIQSLVGATNSHASFIISSAPAQWGTHLVWYPNATLTIEYTPANGNPPSLTILAPANGATVLQGDPIMFSATAFDVDDGNLDAGITWTSSRNGPIGSASSFSTSSLLQGAHVITARATDSSGNTVAKSINLTVQPLINLPPSVSITAPSPNAIFAQGQVIPFQGIASDPEDGNRTVNIQWTSNINGPIGTGSGFGNGTLSVGSHQITATVADTAGQTATALLNIVVQAPANTAPTVSITSPANGASLTSGVSFTLSGVANDLEQGNLSANIQWLLNGTTVIANGATASATISNPGSYLIVARVTDNGGFAGSQAVNVTVVSAPPPPPPPPPPVGYCPLRSNYGYFGYIASVGSGTTINNSGGNINGYQDFTGMTFQWPVGSNPLTLVPGFGSSTYIERWFVWVDLNRDGIFSATERLYSGMSASTINASIAIPAGTATGPTRMRVAMSYGIDPPPCGSFTYGEVEDYTVNILAAGTPPGTPAYCPSRGTNASQEWLQYFMTNNNTSRPTGNDGGYRDYSADWPITLPRGYNYIDVFPYFAGGVTQSEFWNVWIDFNSDGTFAPSELVSSFSSFGSSTYNSFTVPTTLNPGLKTRMRIQMKRGSPIISACETFSFGEVEDHAIQLQ